LSELNTQLLLMQRIGYLADDQSSRVQALVDEVGRLLNAVIRGLRRRMEGAV
jgi:four helix bundle protein